MHACMCMYVIPILFTLFIVISIYHPNKTESNSVYIFVCQLLLHAWTDFDEMWYYVPYVPAF